MTESTVAASNGRVSGRFRLGGAALILLGLAVRLARWPEVFTPEGRIALLPADTHYYIRFALRQFGHFPRFHSFDPYVNHPTGAEIYWPPLHTWFVAGMIALFGKGRPELGAALVDPVLGTVELAVVGWLALRLYGRREALFAWAIYALLPAVADSAPLGCADHHVHEPFFMALICLLLGRALKDGSVRLAVWTGAVLGASRLFSPIEPLLVVPTGVACGTMALAMWRQEAGRAIPKLTAIVGLSASAVLSLSVLAFGHIGSFAYESLSSFHPLFVLSLMLAVAGVTQLIARGSRWWLFLLAAAGVAAPLVPEMLRAFGHLQRADPILATVGESMPMNFRLARVFFGAALLVGPLALVGIVRHLRKGGAELVPTLVAVVVLIPVAMQQIRFVQVLSGPVALLMAFGLGPLFVGFPRERLVRWAVVTIACANFFVISVQQTEDWDQGARLVQPTITWLRDHTPPPSPDGPMGDAKPSYGVVANPLLGHFIALWAERPAVGTSFSQAAVHVAGNERVARVFSTTTDDDTYAAMQATDGRYLILMSNLIPMGHPEVDWRQTFVASLFDPATLNYPGSGHFRLIHDSPEQRPDPFRGSEIRLFEAVPGALLEGQAQPYSRITATLDLLSNLDAPLQYVRSTQADESGHFRLRVAYPTDDPAIRSAKPDGYEVRIGDNFLHIAVSLDEVQTGKSIAVVSGK